MKNKNKMIKRVLNSLKETLSITNISDNIHSSYLLCMNLTFEGKCNNAVIFLCLDTVHCLLLPPELLKNWTIQWHFPH